VTHLWQNVRLSFQPEAALYLFLILAALARAPSSQRFCAVFGGRLHQNVAQTSVVSIINNL
jgi:hypothetical protein